MRRLPTLVLTLTLLALARGAAGQVSQSALRFFGAGTGQQDRVKIPIDPPTPVDVGSDFTIEFWMRAQAGANSGAVSAAANGDGWITGNVLVDRDVYGSGDFGDFGAALGNTGAGCVLAFGADIGGAGLTIVGTNNVADDRWHHIAISRTRSNGLMRIFVDGNLDASAFGPSGDLRYRDGRATAWPDSDPYLVFAAEKHDAGPAYPSYAGYLDEVRIWTQTYFAAQIPAVFNRVIAPEDHPALVAYWRFEEGAGTNLADLAGGTTARLAAGLAGNGEWASRAANTNNTAPLLDAAAAAITTPDQLQILLPLYVYPSWYATNYVWDEVAAAGSNAPVTAIVNPSNGPGTGFPNADYAQGLNDLRAGGVKIIGYVYSSYGARALTNVLADVDAYAASTNVSGVFVDECSTATNDLGYYTQVYAHVKSKPGFDLVVINPGTAIPEPFLAAPAADVALIFESHSGWSNYVPDAYVANYAPLRFAVLPYAISNAAGMNQAVDLAVQRNLGYVYVTDDALPNPWDTLPPYWDELVGLVGAYRRLGGTAVAPSNTIVALSWSAPSNRTCVVESSPAPDDAWNPVSGVVTAGAGGLNVTVPATHAAGVYRLRLFP